MNLTLVKLFLLRSSYQIRPNLFQTGLDFTLSAQSHNLNILNSKFSYMASELIKIHYNSANLFIYNSKFDHFLSPSLTISSKTSTYSNKTYHERIDIPITTTKLKLKDCIWSNFLSNSDKGACFGVQGISEAKISGCSFINIATYTKYSTGKGSFMIIIDDFDDPDEFSFKNNIMVNISSNNLQNTTIYQAFYVINEGSTTFSTNSISLLSQGGTYGCFLQTLSSTTVSNSNFTHSNCQIGSGFNAEFFDKSSFKIRYSILSNLGGFELLRLGCATESKLLSQQQYAKVTIEYVSFYDNEGSLLIALNNYMGSSSFNRNGNFQIRLSMSDSEFFRNKNMTYPLFVKVPKPSLFVLNEFEKCVSDSKLVVQPEVKELYYNALIKGWKVVGVPTDKPTEFSESIWPSPIETVKPTAEETASSMIEPTVSETPKKTPAETPSHSPSPTASISPSYSPSFSPTNSPSSSPSVSPTQSPLPTASFSPSKSPSFSPSKSPSFSPSNSPSKSPSCSPSFSPSNSPSKSPSFSPSNSPSNSPSFSPSNSPSFSPSNSPSFSPSTSPSNSPSSSPSFSPSPTTSFSPSPTASFSPSYSPSNSPSKTPEKTPSFTPSQSAEMTPISTLKQTNSPTPDQTATEPPLPTDSPSTDHVEVVREGEVYTPTSTTSSLLIEGVASINIEKLQDLQFSSLDSSSESSQINLFGRGIEQSDEVSQQDVELTVKEFKNVTINVFNSKRSQDQESVISLPIVVSEVTNFEINNGYQNDVETKIIIKSIIAPTKTNNFISHVNSNSKLNVKQILFSPDNNLKRLHQVVTSHSKFQSNVDSILIDENVEAELVNFTVKDKIDIVQNSDLKLKQTTVNFSTIIEFDVNSINETGQIHIENSKPLNSLDFNSYSFTPNKIKLNIKDNSISDGKQSIVKGISEENCNQMFVSFYPQKNFKGSLYRSSCEDNQLFISVESTPKSDRKKSNKLNSGIIAIAVFGCVVMIAIIIFLIYFRVKKSTKAMIDPSDAYEVSIGSNHSGIYN